MITAAPPFPLRRVTTRQQTVAALNALEPGLTATIVACTRLLEATLAEALPQAGEIDLEAAA